MPYAFYALALACTASITFYLPAPHSRAFAAVDTLANSLFSLVSLTAAPFQMSFFVRRSLMRFSGTQRGAHRPRASPCAGLWRVACELPRNSDASPLLSFSGVFPKPGGARQGAPVTGLLSGPRPAPGGSNRVGPHSIKGEPGEWAFLPSACGARRGIGKEQFLGACHFQMPSGSS